VAPAAGGAISTPLGVSHSRFSIQQSYTERCLYDPFARGCRQGTRPAGTGSTTSATAGAASPRGRRRSRRPRSRTCPPWGLGVGLAPVLWAGPVSG
jgi:hypothetical protein